MATISLQTATTQLLSLLLLSLLNPVDAYYYRRGYGYGYGYGWGWGWAILAIFLFIGVVLIVWVLIYCCCERRSKKKKKTEVKMVTFQTGPKARKTGELQTTIVSGSPVTHVYSNNTDAPVVQHEKSNPSTCYDGTPVETTYFKYV